MRLENTEINKMIFYILGLMKLNLGYRELER